MLSFFLQANISLVSNEELAPDSSLNCILMESGSVHVIELYDGSEGNVLHDDQEETGERGEEDDDEDFGHDGNCALVEAKKKCAESSSSRAGIGNNFWLFQLILVALLNWSEFLRMVYRVLH